MDMEGVLAIIFIFGGGSLFLLALSPVGRALAERIRRQGGAALPEDVRAELDALRSELSGEVQQLRVRVASLGSGWASPSRCLARTGAASRTGRGNEPARVRVP